MLNWNWCNRVTRGGGKPDFFLIKCRKSKIKGKYLIGKSTSYCRSSLSQKNIFWLYAHLFMHTYISGSYFLFIYYLFFLLSGPGGFTLPPPPSWNLPLWQKEKLKIKFPLENPCVIAALIFLRQKYIFFYAKYKERHT